MSTHRLTREVSHYTRRFGRKKIFSKGFPQRRRLKKYLNRRVFKGRKRCPPFQSRPKGRGVILILNFPPRVFTQIFGLFYFGGEKNLRQKRVGSSYHRFIS